MPFFFAERVQYIKLLTLSIIIKIDFNLQHCRPLTFLIDLFCPVIYCRNASTIPSQHKVYNDL